MTHFAPRDILPTRTVDAALNLLLRKPIPKCTACIWPLLSSCQSLRRFMTPRVSHHGRSTRLSPHLLACTRTHTRVHSPVAARGREVTGLAGKMIIDYHLNAWFSPCECYLPKKLTLVNERLNFSWTLGLILYTGLKKQVTKMRSHWLSNTDYVDSRGLMSHSRMPSGVLPLRTLRHRSRKDVDTEVLISTT